MTQKFVISQGKILQDRSLFANYEAVTSILKANTKCWKVLSSQSRGSIESDKPANEWSICLLNKDNFHIVLFPHLSYHIILILLLLQLTLSWRYLLIPPSFGNFPQSFFISEILSLTALRSLCCSLLFCPAECLQRGEILVSMEHEAAGFWRTILRSLSGKLNILENVVWHPVQDRWVFKWLSWNFVGIDLPEKQGKK